jgi:hypothetical protein
MNQFDSDIKATKQMRLPWWAMLCGIIAAALMAWLFDHFGRFSLVRPTLYSVAVLGVAIAIKWKMKRQVWFWGTMAVIVALHVLLILFVPWTTKWIPAVVIIPIGIADLYAILALLSVVGKFVQRPKTSVRS